MVVPYAQDKLSSESKVKSDTNVTAYQDIQQSKGTSSSVDTGDFFSKNKNVLMIGGAVLLGVALIYKKI
jgi:hypothetical protein